MRSAKYKAMARLPCTKCDASFVNTPQLSKHKRVMHTRGWNDSSGSIKNIPIVDDVSLMDLSADDLTEVNTNEISLEESLTTLETTVHIKTNNTDKAVFNCDKCEYSSLTESALSEHMKSKHKESVNIDGN